MKGMADIIAVGIFLSLAPLPLEAQSYPSKPIKIIMGTLPGGRLDLIGRAVLSELETQLKQQVRARGQA